jgi:magnesium chelatase family protein
MGSPGSGKTLLAEKARYLVPPLTLQEQIEITKICSSAGFSTNEVLSLEPPFITPHHTISTAGLVGGGSTPRPGAISLAHKGILFLDEILEFKKSALESLRQPLESKKIIITRSQAEYSFPADFTLLAAANPCPCGYYGDTRRQCQCSEGIIKKYIQKLSGPLSERIDLHVGIYGEKEMPKKLKEEYMHASLAKGIHTAFKKQEKRFGTKERKNADMSVQEVEKYCLLTDEAKKELDLIYKDYALSMRSFIKIKKIARTIADIKNNDIISLSDVYEALSYRPLDRIQS